VADQRRVRAAKRRARRIKAKEHDLTATQWADVKAAWGGCAYCGATDRALQKDCVLPISRGGRYTLDNVVPACRSCNASKCNTETTTWMRRTRRDERAFLERLVAVSRALTADQVPLARRAPAGMTDESGVPGSSDPV
jgi:5-methylcytosine-specific restriction endonuclease McrA